jgi:hypothetical protein
VIATTPEQARAIAAQNQAVFEGKLALTDACRGTLKYGGGFYLEFTPSLGCIAFMITPLLKKMYSMVNGVHGISSR